MNEGHICLWFGFLHCRLNEKKKVVIDHQYKMMCLCCFLSHFAPFQTGSAKVFGNRCGVPASSLFAQLCNWFLSALDESNACESLWFELTQQFSHFLCAFWRVFLTDRYALLVSCGRNFWSKLSGSANADKPFSCDMSAYIFSAVAVYLISGGSKTILVATTNWL